jgi:glucose/arabinose dehydrogenase
MRVATSLSHLLLISLLAFSLSPDAAQAQSNLAVEEAFPDLPDFSRPTDLQHAGDGSGRLFVTEQAGIVKVFENERDASSVSTFLDIRDRVTNGGNEQGLLGLAFHPNFEENGYFFVDYTSASGNGSTVIARYEVDSDLPRADKSSEKIILEVDQPFGNHNAGQIVFGPDSLLYVTLGDGGGGGDPNENGQDRSTLLGSILRIDVDEQAGERAYGIPEGNPFVGNDQGFQEEIYAYGLRNPWRMSFDDSTGRLWVGDVGQNRFEEVDVVEKGENYGWDVMEATHCYEPGSGCNESGKTLPVAEYSEPGRQSLTGGYVYRGPNVPELQGEYVYADYISGQFWAHPADGSPQDSTSRELIEVFLRIPTFGTDANNELYIVAFDGDIYRFEPTATAREDEAALRAFQLRGNAPDPFRRSTTIEYVLPRATHATLAVYDVLGRRVRTLVEGRRSAGTHEARFEAGSLPAGVYVYRLRAGNASKTGSMILTK